MAAIDGAASKWNSAGANFTFTKGTDVNYDYPNVPDGIFQVGWYVDAMQSAHAITICDYPNGVITKVETYFNDYYYFSPTPDNTQFDLLSVILHEFGHWLYLADETSGGDCKSGRWLPGGGTFHGHVECNAQNRHSSLERRVLRAIESYR